MKKNSIAIGLCLLLIGTSFVYGGKGKRKERTVSHYQSKINKVNIKIDKAVAAGKEKKVDKLKIYKDRQVFKRDIIENNALTHRVEGLSASTLSLPRVYSSLEESAESIKRKKGNEVSFKKERRVSSLIEEASDIGTIINTTLNGIDRRVSNKIKKNKETRLEVNELISN